MTDPRNTRDGPDADLPDDLAPLAKRLRIVRPEPNTAFRARLHRSLQAGEAPPPGRVRVLILRYATAGVLLLAIGAISAAGAGPLGG